MNASPTPHWFSSILIFILAFSSILISATPAPQTIPSSSPLNIQFPHLIVPVYEAYPSYASPTMFAGSIEYLSPVSGNEIRLYVGFDVPTVTGGTNCFIKFELPLRASDPGGFPWFVEGGKLDVFSLSSPVVIGQTSWSNRPTRASNTPVFQINQPVTGGPATVTGAGIPCIFGHRMDFEIAATRPGIVNFNWYELDSPKSGITLEIYSL